MKVRVRLIGLPAEVRVAADALALVLVIDRSDLYPCRGSSGQVRLYLETHHSTSVVRGPGGTHHQASPPGSLRKEHHPS